MWMSVRNLALGVLAGNLLIASPLSLAESPSPTAAVQGVVEDVLGLLRNEALAGPDRRAKLRDAIGPHFDFETMSRSILAKAWTNASDAEREQFLALFQNMLENTYIVAMEDYAGQTVAYGKERMKGKIASVETFIVRTTGVKTPVVYSLRTRDGRWLAYDVAVEGISLVNNYRSSFRSIVRKDGMQALLDAMEQKVKEAG